MADLVGWRREVDVRWINPNDMAQLVGSDTGAKLIEVTVKHNDLVMAQLVAVRTNAFPELDR